MRIFKSRHFTRWARKAGLDNRALHAAAKEIQAGAFEADLGGGVIKKRMALAGRGKSGGARTIVAYRHGKHVFFVYGFAKNERDNIDRKELEAFRLLAGHLLGLAAAELATACRAGELIEVNDNEQNPQDHP